MDLISVIIPVYKVEKYLDVCVESVVSQTYRDLEIILVDDGSPDNCGAMCDEWAKKDPRIRVIHKENGGLSDARNVGMEAATGEFMAFVDSDDYVDRQMYDVLLRELVNNDCDVAACGYIQSDGSESFPEQIPPYSLTFFTPVEMQISLMQDSAVRQVVWNKLFRTECIKDIKFEKGKIHEDEFWTYKALARCRKYVAVNYIGYYYFQRSGSIMSTVFSLQRLVAVEAKLGRYQFYRKEFPEIADAARVNVAGSCMYNGMMAVKYLGKEDREKAFVYLCGVYRDMNISTDDIRSLPFKRGVWFALANISFPFCCRIKAALGIGF